MRKVLSELLDKYTEMKQKKKFRHKEEVQSEEDDEGEESKNEEKENNNETNAEKKVCMYVELHSWYALSGIYIIPCLVYIAVNS